MNKCFNFYKLTKNIIKTNIHTRQISKRNLFLLKIPNQNLKNYEYRFRTLNKIQFEYCTVNTFLKSTSRHSLSQKIVGSWLLTCSGMVFVAVILGGVTRLTESGLSMVTWKFIGEKLPLNHASWIQEFEKYKKFPEYKITNKNMSLEEFKRIWWMEYLHRMWGRFIGIAFIIPASYFWINNMLKPTVKKRVLLLGTLIACQGLMGWYMVKSGLENEFIGSYDVPRVSQYRLAAHLGLAFVIYTGFLYTALDHFSPIPNSQNYFSSNLVQPNIRNFRRFKMLVYFCKGLVFLTALSGAFVAGLDAGLVYNTFPKMSNKWIPDDILTMKPISKNFTENPTTVQFNHRILGMLTVSAVTCVGLMSWKYKLSKRLSNAAIVCLCTAYLQMLLGISTLLNHVPTSLGVLHQTGSLTLLSTIVWLCNEVKIITKIRK